MESLQGSGVVQRTKALEMILRLLTPLVTVRVGGIAEDGGITPIATRTVGQKNTCTYAQSDSHIHQYVCM